MAWYSTQKAPEKTMADRAYAACDAKDIALIKKHGVEVSVDGVTWWDVSVAGLDAEVKYLRLRGLIIIHQCHYLVRFRD